MKTCTKREQCLDETLFYASKNGKILDQETVSNDKQEEANKIEVAYVKKNARHADI